MSNAGAIRRLVVKLGSTTVTSDAFDALIDEVADLMSSSIKVVVVTSGAVAAGMHDLGFEERPSDTARAQALAAAGQVALMGRYTTALSRHGVRCAQLLLTHEAMSHRRHLLNIRHALEATLDLGLVPVINENDTVATEELRFGDNDRLAAALGSVVDADLVVLLSDVDALYDSDPRSDDSAQPVRVVRSIDERVRSMAGSSNTALGTGGMTSKIAAAELAMGAGVPLVIASGSEERVLRRLVDGESLGTRFVPSENRVRRRRHWIGFLSKISGSIHVDDGARKALLHGGSSLLAIGVTAVEGVFERGDAVRILDSEGVEIGRGLAGYGSAAASRIVGLRSHEVLTLLGVSVAGPVVHRDDLVLSDQL